MSETDEILKKFELLFGYDFSHNKHLWKFLESHLSESIEEEGVDLACDMFFAENVLYEIEGTPQSEPEPDDEQSPLVLAAHLCGLLSFHYCPFFTDDDDTELMRADLNNSSQNDDVDIYIWNEDADIDDRILSYPMLSSIQEFVDCEDTYHEWNILKHPENDEEEINLQTVFGDFVQKFPKVVNWYSDKFDKYNCKGERQRDVRQNERLRLAHEIALYFSRKSFGLNPSRPESLEFLTNADGEKFDQLYVPHVLLRIFALHEQNSRSLAKEWCNTVLEQNLGNSLAKRWAQRYIDEHWFFKKI